MKEFLLVLAILAGMAGIAILINSKSAIHEIEALVSLLIFAVLISGQGIIGAIQNANPNRIEQKDEDSSKETDSSKLNL